MGNQGPVVVSSQGGVEVAGQGQNVATARADQAEEKKLSVDGKKIYPTDVFADTVHLKTDLTVGGGVALTDGCVSAQHIATDAVTTEKINAGAVTAAEMTVSTLSSISANLGTITGGSLAIGSGGVSIGSSTAGAAIIGNQIYCKKSGATTVLIDGDSGILTATKFQMTADADSSVNLSQGTHIFATSITVGAQTLGDIQTNATNGNAAYAGTTLYRSGGAPTNAPSPTGLTTTTNSNGTVNYKLEWGAYTQGAKQADFIILFWRKDGSAPTVNDSSITFNVNTSGASYYIFEGVNGADTWSWGVAAARRTENGIEIGTIQAPTAAPDWRGVTSGTPNYTANVGGTAAATVASGATAGATAVQPGNGFGVDSNNYPNIISLASGGIEIYTASSGARLLMNNGGLSAKATISGTAKDVVTLDSTNGIRIINYTATPAVAERLSLAYNNGSTTTEEGYIYAGPDALYIGAVDTSLGVVAITGVEVQSHGDFVITSGNKMQLTASSGSVHPTISCGTAPSELGASSEPLGSILLAVGGSLWLTISSSGNKWSRIYPANTPAATAHP
jgi:hypothetical protein